MLTSTCFKSKSGFQPQHGGMNKRRCLVGWFWNFSTVHWLLGQLKQVTNITSQHLILLAHSGASAGSGINSGTGGGGIKTLSSDVDGVTSLELPSSKPVNQKYHYVGFFKLFVYESISFYNIIMFSSQYEVKENAALLLMWVLLRCKRDIWKSIYF